MKRSVKKQCRLLSLILSLSIFISTELIPFSDLSNVQAADPLLNNPETMMDSNMRAGQKTAWDCIYFGEYPQSEVVGGKTYNSIPEAYFASGGIIWDSELYAKLENDSSWDSNDDVYIDGKKYHREKRSEESEKNDYSYCWEKNTYHYFKYEPIKWRILSNDDDIAYLLSDKILFGMQYHGYFETSWEDSALHTYLNNNFYNEFNSIEKQSMRKLGNGDYVTILSEDDIQKGDKAARHGFVESELIEDEARVAYATTYAKATGVWWNTTNTSNGSSFWWLNTPGENYCSAKTVYYTGLVSDEGDDFDTENNGVRPVISVNLNNIYAYQYAGKVYSDGVVEEPYDFPVEYSEEAKCNIIRADYLKNSMYPDVKIWNNMINSDTSCKILMNVLDGDGKCKEAAALNTFWNDVQKAGGFFGNPLNENDNEWKKEQIEVYEGIIISIFANQSQSGNTDYVFSTGKTVEKINSSIGSIAKNKKKWRELNDNEKKDIISDVSEKCRSSLPSAEKQFEEDQKIVSFTISTIFDAIDDLSAASEKIVSYWSIRDMADANKNVLLKMQELCPESESELKEAFNNCVHYMNCVEDDLLNEVLMYECVGNFSYKLICDEIWEKVIDMLPGKASIVYKSWKAAFSISTFAANSLFSADKLAKGYFELKAFNVIYGLYVKTYNYYKSDYDKTNEKAIQFLVAADYMYIIRQKDAELAKDYLKTAEDALWNKFLKLIQSSWHYDVSNTDVYKLINSRSADLKISYICILRNWVIYLENRYPDEYALFKYLLDLEPDEVISKMKVACPVDVYVYDKNGELAASVINNRANLVDDSLTICVIDDVKQVIFTKPANDYDVKLVGNDTGEMDITIEEYNNDVQVRQVQFNDIPLKLGENYQTAISYNADKYQIYHTDGTTVDGVISNDYDTLNINETELYKVSVKNGMACWNGKQGTEIKVPKGADVSVIYCSEKGQEFSNWSVVSGSVQINDINDPAVVVRVSGDVIIEGVLAEKKNEDNTEDIQQPDKGTENQNFEQNTNGNDAGVTPQSSSTEVPVTTAQVTQTPQLAAPAAGTILTDSAKVAKYQILVSSLDGSGAVAFLAPVSKNNKNVTVPDTVILDGISYKVTEIKTGAFKNNKKLKSVTIGSNIEKIGKAAFYGCKNLKTINIKTTKLTSKSVGAKAFGKTAKKPTVKLPKAKKKAYKKWLYKKGLTKKAKIKAD